MTSGNTWHSLRGEASRLMAERRGAVMVEFLAAFLPMFIFFECLVQFAGLTTAKLLVRHAATCAARAAVVVLYDNPQFYGHLEVGNASGKRRSDIRLAAAVPLTAITSIEKVDIALPSGPGQGDDQYKIGPNDLVTVRVTAQYRCFVPLADRIVCNPMTGTRTLVAEASMPNHGVSYPYPGRADFTTAPMVPK